MAMMIVLFTMLFYSVLRIDIFHQKTNYGQIDLIIFLTTKEKSMDRLISAVEFTDILNSIVENYPRELLNLIHKFTYPKFINVSMGHYCSSIVKSDGTIESWGNDKEQISGTPKGSRFTSVSVGYFCSSAIKDDGTIESWGNDNLKQISGTPKGSRFTSVSVGRWCSSAIKDDGTIESWGNDDTQLIF